MTIYEPFIPTVEELISLKLRLAELQPGEVVLDLGCGDARVLIQAVRDHRVTGVGYELRPDLAETARELIRKHGLEEQITIIRGNLLSADLSSADVLILYLSKEMIEQVAGKLRDELRPGVRIVCHTFGLPGWTPEKTLRVQVDRKHTEEVFLYRVGKAAG